VKIYESVMKRKKKKKKKKTKNRTLSTEGKRTKVKGGGHVPRRQSRHKELSVERPKRFHRHFGKKRRRCRTEKRKYEGEVKDGRQQKGGGERGCGFAPRGLGALTARE